MNKEDNTVDLSNLGKITKEALEMMKSDEYKEDMVQLAKFKQMDQEYLDSIDPIELAKAKEMFSKIVIDLENPLEEFVQGHIDYYEGIDDSGDVAEDNI